jgi:uncharacterized membrane protein
MIVQHSHHSGPLPSAREFRIYESVVPGAGNRIIALAEREQAHRHGLESKVVTTELKFKGRGQWFALLALLASLGVVTGFAFIGHPGYGSALGSAVIIGVVALFLGQKWHPNSKRPNSEGGSSE